LGEGTERQIEAGARESAKRAAPQGIRAMATSLILILVVAFGLRIGFAWYNAEHNPHHALGVIPFLFESGNISYSLAHGDGFGSPFRIHTGPTAWMTPIYPLLIAGVFRVFGISTFHSYVAATGLNILFSGLACVPLFFAGKRISGLGTGSAAAWLWALFPNAILIPYESMWDACLAALLAATILWGTLAVADSPRLHKWCGYGLLWGVALMTNATLVLLTPFLLGWMIHRRWRKRSLGMAGPLVAAGVAVLCCLPWTIRNYAVFHSFIPLRSVLGLQLWMGNSEYAQDIWLGTYHPIFNAAERARYIRMGEIPYMQEKQQMAVRYMFFNPQREAHLIWHRFLALWAGGTPYPVADFLRVPGIWFRYVLSFNLLAAIGALCGIIALFRRGNEYAFPIALFPVVFPWAYYLTIVEPRYSLPIEPAVMLLAALALVGFAGLARKRGSWWRTRLVETTTTTPS
jgi:hypothetical protein